MPLPPSFSWCHIIWAAMFFVGMYGRFGVISRVLHTFYRTPHHGKQNVISATVLTENIKRRQVHPYLPTLPCLL
jgi:hypothetical protein